MKYNKLTAEEERVILHKGTEGLLPENITTTKITEHTYAAGAIHPYTVRMINLIRNV